MDEEDLESLSRIVKWVEENKNFDGFRWYHVGVKPPELNSLVARGILEIISSSTTATYYRLKNLKATKEKIREIEKTEEREEKEEEEEPEPEIEEEKEEKPKPEVREEEKPENLFDVIIEYNEIKDVFRRAIERKARTNFLLIGEPATAKSLFVNEISRLPNTELVVGSGLTKVGLTELLLTRKPDFLIIDEIDKITSKDDLSVLLRLMETGDVKTTKHDMHISKKMNTVVFATANRATKLTPELLSRFVVLNFRKYTNEEFKKISMNVLMKREGKDEELAEYITYLVMNKLGSRDIRDCIKIARLSENKDEARGVVKLMEKYRRKVR